MFRERRVLQDRESVFADYIEQELSGSMIYCAEEVVVVSVVNLRKEASQRQPHKDYDEEERQHSAL